MSFMKVSKILRANFLVDGLLEVLRINNGPDFTGAVGRPIRSHHFDRRLASIRSMLHKILDELDKQCPWPGDQQIKKKQKQKNYLLSFSLALALAFRLFAWRRVLFCWPSAWNPPPKMLLPSTSKSSMKSSESRKWLSAVVECLTERRLPPPELPLVVVGAGVWNSPYIRLISALFSSINFSIGSLHFHRKNKFENSVNQKKKKRTEDDDDSQR